jgi:predicted dehydrogenase
MADKVRYLLVGVGANVYGMHEPGLGQDFIEVAAVCDLNETAASAESEKWECPYFLDFEEMVASVKADALIVMVPHFAHARMAIHGMRNGLHVLCEKPMGLQVSEADEMNAVAAETGKILAVNFQQRLRPEVVAAHKLIQSGRLGKIQHVDVKITWTRTYKYYEVAGWRGRWDTEAGALLMNQAPHDLDMVCYLAGQPSRVHAWTPTIAHKIMPEDTVQAMLQWSNGALGSIHASTAEAGQPQRFEIIGTGGHLQINQGSLTFNSFDMDVVEFLKTSEKPFAAPKMQQETIELGSTTGKHADIHRNFCDAILNGARVAAPGTTAIYGLELANAMIYSNYTGQTVDLPLDRQKYSDLLEDLRAKERAKA